MPTYSLADVDAALSKPPSPSDRPGKIYGLRVKQPDGTVVLKAGRSIEPPRRTREWQNQCHKDEITLLWEVPTEHATKLEGLVHRKFKAKNAWIHPYSCRSCFIRHREKFDVEVIGGWAEAKNEVVILAEEMKKRGE
ncbi:hypothetical protein B0H13DRAFT_2328204 [Mycena leptocephala]|nr:hypothetical protein B0H13DRAFT_1882143 [Mycena leptocephala]KAJ7911547.1 hypothetical protein B0H13DRAFT_2328204 [Mycena leptocephala]